MPFAIRDGMPPIAIAAVLAAAAFGSAAAEESVLPPAPAASQPPAEPAESQKNYTLPALEIFAFDVLVNRANAWFGDSADYHVNLSSIRRNLKGGWVADNDPFQINQFMHPYQGSMYHGFARSMGHGFWTSMGYTFAGSLLWEIAGENTPPARNDQVASGIAGSFLGEPLYRMANLVLEHGRM